MTILPKKTEVRRAQKSSHYLRLISKLIADTARDDKELQNIFITQIELSPSGSICYIFCYCLNGEEEFAVKLKRLVLYKTSLRTALAHEINGRYTPELVFKFDIGYAKAEHINRIIDQVMLEENNNVTTINSENNTINAAYDDGDDYNK